MKKYDVIVVGGGFSGIAAAISAARNGASVLLVEKSNCLGGAATNCLVMPFMKFWVKIDDKRIPISKGIFAEIADELSKWNAISGVEFKEEILKILLNRMILKEGIDLLYQARLYDVVKDNGTIKRIKVACVGGTMELEADCFIDTTGDAELAYLSGCPCHIGREDNLCQPMTLCFRCANVDTKAFAADRKRVDAIYREYKSKGKIKNPREDVLSFLTPIKGIVHFNTTRIVKRNPVDPIEKSLAEVEAREQIFEIFEFLKEHSAGFENAELIMTASEIGVRESRMIIGEYILTKEDIIACTKFEDGIAACSYDMDIHNPEGEGTSHYFLPDEEYYTIPYRCLVPKNADNLIVAGRCISSDHEAQSSYRIMPVVCCLGEAAGVAASIAVKDMCSFKNVNVKKLQTTLKEQNAFIGI